MELISRLFSATWILLFSIQCEFIFSLPQLSIINLDHIQQETCPTANEELVSTLTGQLRCCNRCPAGEGMLRLCTNTTQTVCRSCQEGSEFSLVASAISKCMQCKECQELHPFAKFRKHCTPTSDAVCECVAGYFFIEAHSTCHSCTKCPPGYGAEKPCEWNEDSICKPCPEGTWSSTESAAEKCLTCKKCKPGHIEMRPCSATQNTLCCPLHNPNCDDNYENYESDDPKSLRGIDKFSDDSLSQQLTYGDDYPMIIIYCSLLGLVILTLLIYILYKLWQQKQSIEEAKSIEAGLFHPAFTAIKASGGKPKNSKLTVSVKDLNDRQHLLGESQQYSYDPHKSVIPDHLLMELSKGLAIDSRWKQVGLKLGFSEESLQNFEKPMISEDSGDVSFAAKRMLISWYSSRKYNDPSPLTYLLVVLESTSGTSKLSKCLKDYLKSSCGITSFTNSS